MWLSTPSERTKISRRWWWNPWRLLRPHINKTWLLRPTLSQPSTNFQKMNLILKERLDAHGWLSLHPEGDGWLEEKCWRTTRATQALTWSNAPYLYEAEVGLSWTIGPFEVINPRPSKNHEPKWIRKHFIYMRKNKDPWLNSFIDVVSVCCIVLRWTKTSWRWTTKWGNTSKAKEFGVCQPYNWEWLHSHASTVRSASWLSRQLTFWQLLGWMAASTWARTSTLGSTVFFCLG